MNKEQLHKSIKNLWVFEMNILRTFYEIENEFEINIKNKRRNYYEISI